MKVIVIKGRTSHGIVATYICNDDMEVSREVKDMIEEMVRNWILLHMQQFNYGTAFDLAVDCASDLGLCEYDEITGDNTLVPNYIVEIAAQYLPRG